MEILGEGRRFPRYMRKNCLLRPFSGVQSLHFLYCRIYCIFYPFQDAILNYEPADDPMNTTILYLIDHLTDITFQAFEAGIKPIGS